MQVFIYCEIALYVSGVQRIHHQAFGHVGGRLLQRYYDLYQKLQLQFYVHLMMGAKDTRKM
jgi:hypothetical protein